MPVPIQLVKDGDILLAIIIHEKKDWNKSPIGSRLKKHGQVSTNIIIGDLSTKNATVIEIYGHHLDTFFMSLEDGIKCDASETSICIADIPGSLGI